MTGAAWVLLASTVILAVLASWYKRVSEELGEHVLVQYKWIDEVIDALEDADEVRSNERLDGLVAQRLDNVRAVPSEH